MLTTSSLLEMMKQCSTLFRMLLAHNSKPLTLVRPPGSLEYAYDTILQPAPCSLTKLNTSRVSYCNMVWRTASLHPPPSVCPVSTHIHWGTCVCFLISLSQGDWLTDLCHYGNPSRHLCGCQVIIPICHPVWDGPCKLSQAYHALSCWLPRSWDPV